MKANDQMATVEYYDFWPFSDFRYDVTLFPQHRHEQWVEATIIERRKMFWTFIRFSRKEEKSVR